MRYEIPKFTGSHGFSVIYMKPKFEPVKIAEILDFEGIKKD